MKHLEQVLQDYAEYHQNKVNKYTHYFGIPLIVFGLLICLSWLNFSINPILNFSLMWIVVFSVSIYYLILDLQVGIIVAFILFVLATIAGMITDYAVSMHGLLIFVTTFLGGWVLQLIGHYFERRRPALMDNFFQVFSAPVFLVVEVLVKLGKRNDLKHLIRKKADLLDQENWDQ